ncbi:Alkaline phytoceramidase (aPHC) [Herbaspirillum sp. CF444]|uniref:ceramidase domain-containing protein n=1 Tax=Herbaspirillum sp. CF444 TaxID=1144319 RepID=UPI0002725D2F|nr:ceramidase domain-containing protein [Herbaspirillum sp. CF444]EJL94051.1 Alkaline phytoceramidase (aPHC) [Herbaspirillum sp. CF444]
MNESFFAPVDLYCERLSPNFWAEPVNALSNAGFLLAAYCVWRLLESRGLKTSITTWILTLMIAVIGIGSFLFHTFAVRWALFADVIPISIYQVLFLTFYLCQVARLSALKVGGWVIAFFAVTYWFGALPAQWLNGSLSSYGSAWLFIAGLGIYHWRTRKHEPMALLLAAGVFSLSLIFRSADMAVCKYLSIGTHMFWHLLNSVVLYLTTRAFILNLRAFRQANQA